CAQAATCAENADTPVRFDLTIMRRAQQGFFDIAVSFEDVFCSAKVDCEDRDGDPLELLFDGDERASTAVLALACTAGANETNIYLDDVVVDCGPGAVHSLVPVGARGNRPGIAASPIFGWALYAGAGDQGL